MIMAKAPARYINTNKADLILPDGTVIPADGEFALDAALLQNLGVQMWIEAGQLTAKE